MSRAPPVCRASAPPYVLEVALPAAPIAGREAAAWQDDELVWNVALTVPGEERRVKATAADLSVMSKWFGGKMRQRGDMVGGGSKPLLAGVEVPVEVPFAVLKDFIEGLYAGRFTLTEANLHDTLVLADAMQASGLLRRPTLWPGATSRLKGQLPAAAAGGGGMVAACLKALAESLCYSGRGTPSWAVRVFETGGARAHEWEKDLQLRALGHACYRALSDQAFLQPLAAMLATVPSPARLTDIKLALGQVFPSKLALWPTGPVVCLLLRLDQLVEAAEATAEAAACPGSGRGPTQHRIRRRR